MSHHFRENDRDVIAETVMDFILHRFPAMGGALESDTPLLEGASIDSLGVLELMIFLGERFGFEISDEVFVPENFESVDQLVRFVSEKRSASQ